MKQKVLKIKLRKMTKQVYVKLKAVPDAAPRNADGLILRMSGNKLSAGHQVRKPVFSPWASVMGGESGPCKSPSYSHMCAVARAQSQDNGVNVIKKLKSAGEMAKWIIAQTTLLESPGLVPRIHMDIQFQGVLASFYVTVTHVRVI